jgi:ribosome-associated protein
LRQNGEIMIEFELDGEYIELYKLIKFENLVESGGEAKFVISEGLVLLNGAMETQKRKKVRKGDVVAYKRDKITVI